MKKIAIISSFDRFYEMYSLLYLSNEEWDIVGVFMNIPSAVYDAKTNVNLQPIQEMSTIANLDVEVILIGDAFKDILSDVAGKLVGEENVLLMGELKEKYAPNVTPMDILRKHVEIFYPRIKSVGKNVTIGDFTYDPPLVHNSSDEYSCKIGKFCAIAKGVEIFLYMEHRPDWGTIFPFNELMSDYLWIEGSPASKGDVVIGNDVWIGANTFIMSGVEIGDGCIIGAHSTVTKSLPPYSVAVGSPATIIKQRFSSELTEKFLEMKWWDWEEHLIYEAIPLLQSEKYEELYEFYLSRVKK